MTQCRENTTDRREDRIDRAAWLIGHGYVQPGDGADVLTCWSQQFGEEKIYEVTTDSCTCWEGENRRRIICKHRMACFAPAMVLMVLELREAPNVDTLKSIGESYAEAIGLLDPIFVERAKEEYRKVRDELNKAI
jgi:hypothetical protein